MEEEYRTKTTLNLVMRTVNTTLKSLRAAARHIALDALSHVDELSATAEKIYASDSSRVLIILMHDLEATEEKSFEDFLSWANNFYRFESYGNALAMIASNSIDAPTMAFTFDDGLISNTRAARVLERFNTTACFFICPGVVDLPSIELREKFCVERLHRPPMSFMDWNEIELLKKAGHEIGSHTNSHPMLSKVPLSIASEELEESRDRLIEVLGSAIHFAWPYGTFDHISPKVIQKVLSLGYDSCASGVRGSHQDSVIVEEFDGHLSCVRRNNLEMSWPLRHKKYLVNRSYQDPYSLNNSA